MKLTREGMVKVDGHNVMRTDDGRWYVSRHGIYVGYADMLDDVPALIACKREAVKARLADVQRRAEERAALDKAEADSIAAATQHN